MTARKWLLPDSLEKAILNQDTPEVFSGKDPYLHKLTSVVYIADKFCCKLGIGMGHKKTKGIKRPLFRPGSDSMNLASEIDGLLAAADEIYKQEKGRID